MLADIPRISLNWPKSIMSEKRKLSWFFFKHSTGRSSSLLNAEKFQVLLPILIILCQTGKEISAVASLSKEIHLFLIR